MRQGKPVEYCLCFLFIKIKLIYFPAIGHTFSCLGMFKSEDTYFSGMRMKIKEINEYILF